MGFFLFFVGFAVNAVCGVIILIKAFKVSVGWGLAVFFIPFAGLFFVFNHWEDTKKPFLGALGSGALMFLGALIIVGSKPDTPRFEQPQANQVARVEEEEEEEAPPPRPANYASAAAPVSYQPPRSSYVPSYNPPPEPPPAVKTDPKAVEEEWSRKPALEQVYVDRATGQFYPEKCRKRPADAYRIPRSVALMQGMTEAKCR